MHELLALGMQHEHQHPDRPFDISACTFDLYYSMELTGLTAVVSDMKDEGWSGENINDNIVKRFDPNTLGSCSRPDSMSSSMK